MTKFERITLIASIMALVISIVSASFSFWQWFDSKKEKIKVEITHPEQNYSTKIEIHRTEDSLIQILPVFFKCIVQNIGDKKVSITDYSQIEIIDSTSTDTSSVYSYSPGNSWTNRGLYETFDKQIFLPIDIDANSSRSFYIKVGLTTNIDSIYWHYRDIKTLESALLDNCLDIYGNRIAMFFRNDHVIVNRECFSDSLSFPNYKDGQYFKVSFLTSKKNNFSSMMYWYRPEK